MKTEAQMNKWISNVEESITYFEKVIAETKQRLIQEIHPDYREIQEERIKSYTEKLRDAEMQLMILDLVMQRNLDKYIK